MIKEPRMSNKATYGVFLQFKAYICKYQLSKKTMFPVFAEV